MSTQHRHAAPVRMQRRREIFGIVALSTLSAFTGVWASTSATSRPALERLIQTAKLLPLCRLWAVGAEKFAKNPTHPFSALVVQIQRSNDSELLPLLVQIFQGLTEEESNELIATLETPLGQWIVQSSLWSRKSALSPTSEFGNDPLKDLGSRPRRLTNTEIRAIKAFGSTPQWKALRRVGNAFPLGQRVDDRV